MEETFNELGEFESLGELFGGDDGNSFVGKHWKLMAVIIISFVLFAIFIIAILYFVVQIQDSNDSPATFKGGNTFPGSMKMFRVKQDHTPEYGLDVKFNQPNQNFRNDVNFGEMLYANAQDLDNYSPECKGFTGSRPNYSMPVFTLSSNPLYTTALYSNIFHSRHMN
jgi:hypothetical protein